MKEKTNLDVVEDTEENEEMERFKPERNRPMLEEFS